MRLSETRYPELAPTIRRVNERKNVNKTTDWQRLNK